MPYCKKKKEASWFLPQLSTSSMTVAHSHHNVV